MKKQTQKVKLAEIVEDYTLYPRPTIDSNWVSHLRRKLEGGSEFPPMVVEAETLKLVDGFHRKRAYLLVLGADGEVEVEPRRYENDAALYADALALNAPHGKPLTSYDAVTAVTKGEKLGLSRDTIADSLGVTRDYIDKLVTRRTAVGGNGESQPLKFTVEHMAGEPITEGQVNAMPKIGGMSQHYYVRQVILLLRNYMVDAEDERLIASLRELNEALVAFLEKEKASA